MLGAGLLGFVMVAFWLIRRKEGGLGDVKLLAMIGAFLGAVPAVPFVIFVSAAAGSMVGIPAAILRRRGMGAALPFGPFLALGALAASSRTGSHRAVVPWRSLHLRSTRAGDGSEVFDDLARPRP